MRRRPMMTLWYFQFAIVVVVVVSHCCHCHCRAHHRCILADSVSVDPSGVVGIGTILATMAKRVHFQHFRQCPAPPHPSHRRHRPLPLPTPLHLPSWEPPVTPSSSTLLLSLLSRTALTPQTRGVANKASRCRFPSSVPEPRRLLGFVGGGCCWTGSDDDDDEDAAAPLLGR